MVKLLAVYFPFVNMTVNKWSDSFLQPNEIDTKFELGHNADIVFHTHNLQNIKV